MALTHVWRKHQRTREAEQVAQWWNAQSTCEDLDPSPTDTKIMDLIWKSQKPWILTNGTCLSSMRLWKFLKLCASVRTYKLKADSQSYDISTAQTKQQEATQFEPILMLHFWGSVLASLPFSLVHLSEGQPPPFLIPFLVSTHSNKWTAIYLGFSPTHSTLKKKEERSLSSLAWIRKISFIISMDEWGRVFPGSLSSSPHP